MWSLRCRALLRGITRAPVPTIRTSPACGHHTCHRLLARTNTPIGSSASVYTRHSPQEERIEFEDLAPPPPPPSLPPSMFAKYVPRSWLPYLHLARLDKPIGTWLLLFPCWWSVALAAPSGHLPDLRLMLYFAIGAFVMRGAGCTINDMWDRDYDRRVERTLSRPLASNQLTLPQAGLFLLGQLAGGLALVLNFNLWTVAVAFGSIPIVILYPLMKRVTHLPQLVLGLCFNWGAIVGYSSVTGAIEPSIVLPLYASGILWTLIYDTIYAHQDIADDKLIGVKSTAILFHSHTRAMLLAFTAVFAALLVAVGVSANMGAAYYAVSVGGGAAHLLRQLRQLNIHDRGVCLRLFQSNQWIGWIVLLGIILDKLVQSQSSVKAEQVETKSQSDVAGAEEDPWQLTGYQLLQREYRRWRQSKLPQPQAGPQQLLAEAPHNQ